MNRENGCRRDLAAELEALLRDPKAAGISEWFDGSDEGDRKIPMLPLHG